MKKFGEYSFFFKEDSSIEEYKIALNKTIPTFASKLNFSKVTSNFNTGDFSFFLKGKNGREFEIPFHNATETINDFWIFLEHLTETDEALILPLFYKGKEVIIYTEPKEKDSIRFVVMNTNELYKKSRKGEILRYTYADCDIDIDIIIRKKQLIKQFYNELFNLFENYKNIAVFEPPLIDFDFWIKDSFKIKCHVKGVRFLKKMGLIEA